MSGDSTENFPRPNPSSLPEGPENSLPDDPRLLQIAEEYLAELESGAHPDKRRWLEGYPDLAEALAPCLEGLELVHRAAPLASPLLDSPLRISSAPLAGRPLGDFQIVREIGRGGMGIVYEATQMSLGRRVALKVLPFAATFDAKHLQRFRQEAQAAAQLHHTNIVPVYGVGCERGIHFYAMQLIEGQSLEAVIRQLRQEAGMQLIEDDGTGASAGKPGSTSHDSPAAKQIDEWQSAALTDPAAGLRPAESQEPSATERQVSAHFSTYRPGKESELYRTMARCMAQAAEALEYAHQQGVVHRDIKPGNLMVDFQGKVWVTDFGLAHLHDAPGLTHTGDVVGTIRYMSPEQASGQRVVLDHRTDIYSLGATFYELMTLRPVFSGKTRQALLADVLNQEPRSPRSLDRRIPVELEIILLKSLNKNPVERFASAQELADDLHRYLRDEPIRAKRPSPAEHVRKWARRHPSLIAAGVLVLLITLIGSLVSNWLITDANRRANAALTEAQLRADEAEKRFRQARQAADLLVELSEKELADAPPAQGLRKRLLETAIAYYQDFIRQRQGDSTSQAELIAVRDRLKKSLDDLAVLEGAGQFLLLADRRVQADLGLEDSQRQKIDALSEDFAQKRIDLLHDYPRASSPERQNGFIEIARANDRAMRAILRPTQLQRLEQITFQLHGTRSLHEAEVAAKLRLTDAQRRAIHQAESEAFKPPWASQSGKPPSAPSTWAKAARRAMEKALDVLTPEQRAEWEKLSGPPFKDVYEFAPPEPLLSP